ncbi:MAG: hypothetical protein LBH45_02300 [Campylobacteraceae bacterium]|jgi:hypothetical protein|nr:hypothetical protein [Campylobacteraceae bacterium]
MKKVFFLIIFMLTAMYGENTQKSDGGFYVETNFNFAENKDKKIGGTQSAKELTGKRKSINELDLGIYLQDSRMGAKLYGSVWFGNADQYGLGFGIEGKYKPFPSVPIALFVGFDEKIGIGDDVFEERNVTVSAINSGAPTMIYLTEDTRFDSSALKFGIEWEISKHFAINVAYMPRWDRYKIKYNQKGMSFRNERETSWHEFSNSVIAGVSVRF